MKQQFSRYSLIGVFNTLLHWVVFAIIVSFGFSQAAANGWAFAVAASVSYLLNSRFTFQQTPQKKGYVFFVVGMGSISVLVGLLGDVFAWPGLLTLVLFSALSLTLGFAWSKWVVFKP